MAARGETTAARARPSAAPFLMRTVRPLPTRGLHAAAAQVLPTLEKAAPGEAEEPRASEQRIACRRAGLHALLRVCGVGRRADAALRIVISARRQGDALDASFWTAYLNGREEARGPGGPRLLESGYERLLQLEVCPEKLEGVPRLGRIERIRIQW